MKKSLIAFLLSCSCALTLAAVACGDTSSSESSESIISSSVSGAISDNSSSTVEQSGSPSDSASSGITSDSSVESSSGNASSGDSSSTTPSKTVNVTLTEGAGYSYADSNLTGSTMNAGDVLSFSIKMSVFYTGYPVVSVNGKAVLPNDDGVYNVELTEDTVVTVAGVQKEISSMQGSGAFDDAYVVSRPVDLLYIAEQVNKGVYSYVTGAYVLANDIDCGGEELEIIGDLSTENSYFSGCFSCLTNSETGEMERYTISNFTINSDDANYVGLFGAVYADFTVQSSGLFYGICLDNFTINASISEDANLESGTIACGSLIGYGVGANLFLCDATNGTINLYGDTSYFSFAGGLIGYQQGFYNSSYGAYFPSEIVYSVADVDVKIVGGMALYAGGISGYLATNYPFGATAFIHNSYSHGNVSGALRSGGIAGGLGQYTSVSNCYATGEIVANCTQSLTDAITSSPEYCYSHAGGLVGFAENDTIVNDSFFAGSTQAYAVSAGCAITGDYIAGGYEKNNVSAISEKYVVDNCINNYDPKNIYAAIDVLGWQDYDWVFEDVTYPEIFYGTPSGDTPPTATMKFSYVSLDGEKITVNGSDSHSETYFNMATEASNIYAPLGAYIINGLGIYFQADNNYLSFGFFFDKECTRKVPYSYVPEKNVEIFVGFANPEPIVGTYYVVSESNADVITLDFAPNGIVTYSDGYTTQEAYYSYDGTTLIVEGARLARYYDGEIVIEDTSDTSVLVDENFDLYRYMYYDFAGSVDTENKIVYLYDLVYFTESAPLVAKASILRGEYVTVEEDTVTYYTFYGDFATVETVGASYTYAEYDVIALADGMLTFTDSTNTYSTLTVAMDSLSQYDAFKGTWTKSATINKSYTFDGIGGWSYKYKSYERSGNGYMGYTYEEHLLDSASGEYTVADDVLTFVHDGVTYTASFDADGFLAINDGNATRTYYREESYLGTWTGGGISLELLGVQKDGTGTAIVTYDADGYSYDLVYELSATEGYVMLYFPHASYWKDTAFGYFTYDVSTNTLLATIVDPYSTTSGYTTVSLFVTDNYEGEWICNAESLQNVEFRFNGYGLYGFLNGYAGMKGEVVLLENGKETIVEYVLDSTMTGNFSYGGVHYVMTYDEDAQAIILTAESGTAQLERKDRFAGLEFIDANGNVYVFDGKSNLSIGGSFTVNGETNYRYVAFENDTWKVYDAESLIGSLTVDGNHYVLTINGTDAELYIANEFMGKWAISGKFATLSIGATNLNGEVSANFMGNEITLTYLDPATLTFRYMDGSMPVQYYVFVVFDSYTNENVLVLSQYTSIAASGGDYMICTKANTLFGTWTLNKDPKMTISFDGVTSGYANGVAHLSRNGNPTPYFYMIYDNGILFWSQDLLGGRTLYYKIVEIDLEANPAAITDPNAYVNEDGTRAFYRIEVDGLYLTEAKDSKDSSIVYFFDGESNLLVDGEIVYTYVIRSYNGNSTATLEVTDVETNVTYSATLDYSSANNEILIIGEPIEE